MHKRTIVTVLEGKAKPWAWFGAKSFGCREGRGGWQLRRCVYCVVEAEKARENRGSWRKKDYNNYYRGSSA